MDIAPAGKATRWTTFTIFSIALVALAVRLLYVHTTVVDHPVRGDARQYLAYAFNLLDHHTFSMAVGDTVRIPDSFRDPGYPVFLAAMMGLLGKGQAFYVATLDAQAVMAAVTVLIYMLLAKRWMGTAASIVVGAGMALWPHCITLPGYLLSETLMGLLVALGIWLTDVAVGRKHPFWFAMAGLTLAAAALTNAIFSPVAPLFAVLALWRDPRHRRLWLVFLVSSMLPLAGWAARGHLLPTSQTSGNRVMVNFVQGSWPEYHDAWKYSLLQHDDASVELMGRMDSEYEKIQAAPLRGLSAVASRMAEHPARYIAWYASKPLELWGWNLGIGVGDIYVFPVYNSPLSTPGILKAATDIMFFFAPLVLLLATAGLILAVARWRTTPMAMRLGVMAVSVLTLVCAILQSDARYAAPYRGLEWIFAALSMIEAGKWWSQRKGKVRRPSIAAP